MDTNVIVMGLQDKLPKDMGIMSLRNELDKASATQRDEFAKNLPLLNLKSPAKVFWLGSFLFGVLGVGRFMIGNMKLGAARLLLFLATISLVWFLVYTWLNYRYDCFYDCPLGLEGDDYEGFMYALWFLVGVLYVAMMLWFVIDLFLTGKTLRKKNLDKCLKLAQGLSPSIINLMEKMPHQPLKVEELQKQILALDENRRQKVLKDIEEEVISPSIASLIMIVAGLGFIVLLWFVFYEWLEFSHNNKIVNGIWGLCALAWLIFLFKGESIIRDSNFWDADEIVNKKENSPKNLQKGDKSEVVANEIQKEKEQK